MTPQTNLLPLASTHKMEVSGFSKALVAIDHRVLSDNTTDHNINFPITLNDFMEDIMQKILPHKNVFPKDPYSYMQMSGVHVITYRLSCVFILS